MTPEELYQEGLEAYSDSNYEAAFSYFRQAAEQGHTKAEYEVGFCYAEGDGVAMDDYKAAKWFRKAAIKGHMEAQFELAEFLEYEYYGDSYALKEAFGWYKKAADQGHLDSAFRVGKMYKYGAYTEQNYEKAMEYFRKVAFSKADAFDYPIEDSMREIGWLFYYGQGVEKDERRALIWFKKSVELIRQYPKQHEWYEKVESLVNNADIWEHLKRYIDKNGNIIDNK